MKSLFNILIYISLVMGAPAYAITFPINGSVTVFGDIKTITPQNGDTFSNYAHVYDVGAYAIQSANPGIDENYPDKQKDQIIIPAAFILPTKQEGIVINLPELRLYYFNQSQISTYPISIGRVGWKTPIRETQVIEKITNPYWHVPKSILAEHAAKGRRIPKVVPPGPDNPLGKYALRLGITGYLMHGTNAPTSIGRRVSHGCIRLFPTDIEELFHNVPVGTPVSLINEPVKAGWRGNELYLVVHPLLHEYPMSHDQLKALVTDKINYALNGKQVNVNWDLVETMIKQQTGIVDRIAKE
ncbi:MAG TPA: L,D-transpeptidase family protein [Gammaproteobacteria bacterium]|nr:L,D-transpeptidase family protein [Gammaproteobacteria bacterium]